MATRTFREKKHQQSQVFLELFLMSTLTWITEKELERVIKNNGDEFHWKKNMKFHSGEKNKNEQKQKQQNFWWAHTTIPP